MAIFNKCHALFLGFLVFAIVGAAGYSVNQGDYFQHQYTFIIIKSLLLFLSFGYAKWFDMISFGILSRKQLLLFIGIFLLSVLETLVYIHFFWRRSSTLGGSQQRNFPVFDFDAKLDSRK